MSSGAANLWHTLIDAWKHRDQIGEANHERQLLQFLPAALEVQQTPPSPMGRAITWCLLALVAIGILWAFVGQVNIVASAEGKITPSSQVKQIQPLEKGVIKAIYVEEGQGVKKGDPLIELEQTLTEADQKRLAQELVSTRQERIRLQTLQRWFENNRPDDQVEWLTSATPLQHKIQQQQLEQTWYQYRAQLHALQSAYDTRQAEWQQSQALITKYQQTLPLIEKRAQALKTLMEKQASSEMEWLEIEALRIQQAQDLEAEKANAKKLQSAIKEVEQQAKVLQAQTQAENLAAITQVQRQLANLIEEFNKAQDINAKQILYAPVDGTVKQLATFTIGGVVTPAQVLLEIVPEDEVLVVEAWLPNKDIGFVQEGQEAEIKVHTFPFTKYGIIDATITHVTNDAIADENLGLVYKMKLVMAKKTLWVDTKEVDLLPGMAVTAEIKTGHRRIIEFISAPLLRYKSESVRER